MRSVGIQTPSWSQVPGDVVVVSRVLSLADSASPGVRLIRFDHNLGDWTRPLSRRLTRDAICKCLWSSGRKARMLMILSSVTTFKVEHTTHLVDPGTQTSPVSRTRPSRPSRSLHSIRVRIWTIQNRLDWHSYHSLIELERRVWREIPKVRSRRIG